MNYFFFSRFAQLSEAEEAVFANFLVICIVNLILVFGMVYRFQNLHEKFRIPNLLLVILLVCFYIVFYSLFDAVFVMVFPDWIYDMPLDYTINGTIQVKFVYIILGFLSLLFSVVNTMIILFASKKLIISTAKAEAT